MNQTDNDDYPGQHIPKRIRDKTTIFKITSSSLGGLLAYLADLAIGASIGVNYGAKAATIGVILAACINAIITGPLILLACKYNIDLDLIGRATFGFLGSITTNLIYSAIAVIWFVLEAAMMSQELYLINIPLTFGYIISTIIVFPFAFYGIKILAKLQTYTTPIWIIMMLYLVIYVLIFDSNSIIIVNRYVPKLSQSIISNIFSTINIVLSLIMAAAPISDYLRQIPSKTTQNHYSWYMGVMLAGPGWIIFPLIKQLIGIYFGIYLYIKYNNTTTYDQPVVQLFTIYNQSFPYSVSLIFSVILVFVSQLKINVSNVYVGSLALSNSYTRITKKKIKRVYFIILNMILSLIMMELNAFDYLNQLLSFMTNFSIAWIVTIFSDIIFNMYILKLKPSIPEFKRGFIYNYNPVGLISLFLSLIISCGTLLGIFGDNIKPFSSMFGLIIALILPPIIAYITNGKYYLRRRDGFNHLTYDMDNNPVDTEYMCHVCNKQLESFNITPCIIHQNNYICCLCLTIQHECYPPDELFINPRQNKPFFVLIQEIFTSFNRSENIPLTTINTI